MISARRLYLALLLSAVLGCVPFSIAVYGKTQGSPDQPAKQQDQPPDQSATHKEEHAKGAKKERSPGSALLPALLWRDPGDVASLDLVYGAGGAGHAPRPDAKYTFVKEDMNGTSAKFYVKDDSGVEWLVKLGEEAKPETAATRLVWAVGFFTDEDYFVPTLHVSAVPKLHRGDKDVAADGTVMNVRLKRQGPDLKKIQNWDWRVNPFLGTPEFNRLRVMMALINNWDLTTVNNKIYVTDTERHYLVSDLGASFGKTGAVATRSKGVLKDYADSKFVRERKGDMVSFEMRTRPLPVFAPFELKNYEKRSRMEQIEDDIPVADAAWIGSELAKLSPQQLRDAFRTAGFSADEVEGYASAVQKRIADLNQLKP